MEIFQLLCVDKTVPYESLCQLFNQETQNGNDLSVYNSLISKAVNVIGRSFKKRLIANLQSERNGELMDLEKQITASTQFDLVTWLIIKDENNAV